MLQGIWAAFLVLPRTYDPATGTYGNLYSNLLDYVISAALIFYILTIAGVFRLRRTRPDMPRPVPRVRLSRSAGPLHRRRGDHPARPVHLPASTTWPGLVIVLLGVPAYFAWKPRGVK